MILYVLLQGDSYGYAISKRIREISAEKYIIKETTLYSAFTRLENNGYIEAYSGGITHGKPRTYYKIAQKGREYYTEKCEEWKITQEVIEKFVVGGNKHGNN